LSLSSTGLLSHFSATYPEFFKLIPSKESEDRTLECALIRSLLLGEIAIAAALIHANVAVNIEADRDDLSILRPESRIKKLIPMNDYEKAKGLTPLMLAAFWGSYLVKGLLDAGADKNAQNNYGFTPLMCASGEGHLHTVRVLITSDVELNNITLNGDTAVMRAAAQNHADVVKVLCQAGARLDIVATGGAPL